MSRLELTVALLGRVLGWCSHHQRARPSGKGVLGVGIHTYVTSAGLDRRGRII
jgi:hypothetical protein